MNRILTIGAALLLACGLAGGRNLRAVWWARAETEQYFTIAAEPTGADTVRINRLRSSEAFTLDWGDGTVTNLAAATNYDLQHTYAGAGSYTIQVSNPDSLTQVWIYSQTKLGGIKSAELTFDSADVSDWRPTSFYLHTMPTGYAGTFDSADVSDWRPTSFYLYTMPTGTYSFTISANSFQHWATGLRLFYMHNNSLSTAQVDLILWELYQAATSPRTASGGTILLHGSNDSATGTFQASTDDPVTAATDGAEVAYELREDSLGEGFNTWGAVTINTE